MNKSRTNQGGFTLIEVIVAIAIFAIVLLGTASMLFNSLATSLGSSNRFTAGNIAQGRVETLSRTTFSNLSTTASQVLSNTVNGVNFSTRGTTSTLASSVKSVTVTTSWQDKLGSHSVRLSTVRTD